MGWWLLIPTLVLCSVPYFLISQKRWWPGAWGWACVILSIGILAADGFKAWGPVGFAGLFFGFVLGFAGSLNGPNSPAN